MKIAISAMEPGLGSEVDPRFGRSQYFILVEPETMQFETIRNPHLEASSGAGIGAAQLVCDKGAGAVITGKIGPKAHRVLSAAGVRMLTGVSGKIGDAIERFKAGMLLSDVDSGSGPGSPTSTGIGPGTGMGGGRGMGMGRGTGRGMGRGIGCGGGKGLAMGLGQGGGGGGKPLRGWDAEPWSERTSEPSGQDDIAALKQQARTLAENLEKIQQRIEQMEQK
jgi:predicted Fe-Mo cluster-binding NifX family protein